MLSAPCAADLAQNVFGRLIGADVLADVQRDDVRVLLAADVILGDLGAGNHQHAVELASPARASAAMSAR